MAARESRPLKPGRRPTIYDIAARLDIDPSTVSRALNKPGRISAVTEARVRAVADALGFTTNAMARALPTGKTGTYGLVLPDITNPVHFELIRGVEQVARERGHALLITETQATREVEAAAVARLQSSVDGIVIVSSRLDDAQLQEIAAVTPLVGANMFSEAIPTIVPDIRPGLKDVISLLDSLGHTSIGYVGGRDGPINTARWRILFDEAVSRRMSIVEFAGTDSTIEYGPAALPWLLASGVTAVLTYNDLVAHGILRACRASGVEAPGRLSVIGFDDIFSAELASPPLTTLRLPLAEIGRSAMRLLYGDPPGLELSTQLMVRASTGPAPK